MKTTPPRPRTGHVDVRTSWARLSPFAYALVLTGWAWLFAAVWLGPATYQFDFKTYYGAVRVYESGRSPYDVANIREDGANPHLLGFYYPLSTLHLLRPLGALDYVFAHRLWVTLKALAMAALLLVWKRSFLSGIRWLWILAVALLGFNAATMWDVKVGNITVFEQLFLWTGFAFLLKRRPTLFVACVVLASVSKLLPAAFLLLLFLPALHSRANTLRAAAGALVIAVVTLAPFAANPEYFSGFLRGLTTQHPRLEFNPSIAGVADEIAFYAPATIFASPAFKIALIATYVAIILFAGRRLLRWAFGSASLRTSILAATLLYALLAPRLIIYAYMIAIVPALGLLVPAAKKAGIGQAAAAVALCVGGLAIVPSSAGKFVADGAPLLLLLGGWIALVVVDSRGELAALIEAEHPAGRSAGAAAP